jgi:hypothetical protein
MAVILPCDRGLLSRIAAIAVEVEATVEVGLTCKTHGRVVPIWNHNLVEHSLREHSQQSTVHENVTSIGS